jgi:hypothetical protein
VRAGGSEGVREEGAKTGAKTKRRLRCRGSEVQAMSAAQPSCGLPMRLTTHSDRNKEALREARAAQPLAWGRATGERRRLARVGERRGAILATSGEVERGQARRERGGGLRRAKGARSPVPSRAQRWAQRVRSARRRAQGERKVSAKPKRSLSEDCGVAQAVQPRRSRLRHPAVKPGAQPKRRLMRSTRGETG